jgi:N-acetylglucosamine malate deacetylase 1
MNPPPVRRVVLGFFAHPDDAEFLCTGTLMQLADAGWEVHIATATPGDCGSATLPADEISEIRRNEGVEAASRIGATYHCLEEADVHVVFDKPSCQKAIDLFRNVAPSLVFTHPRIDYMLDHEQVHLLARCAAFSYPIPNASPLPLRDGSAVPWLYYCDPLEGADPYTGEPVEPTRWIDISPWIDRKVDMLACHASQRAWLQAHHGMDEYIEAMKRHGAFRGNQIDVSYAEAFVQHPGHPFPQSDLLGEQLVRVGH